RMRRRGSCGRGHRSRAQRRFPFGRFWTRMCMWLVVGACSRQVSFGPADSAFTPINVRMARDPGAFGARLGSCELHGGCCCEVLARFVISRHGTGTDVIYPAMQGEITLFQSSHNRGM